MNCYIALGLSYKTENSAVRHVTIRHSQKHPVAYLYPRNANYCTSQLLENFSDINSVKIKHVNCMKGIFYFEET